MKTLVFDLDGTMYRGTQIIESAHQFLDYCIQKDIPFIFLTNNSMRTPQENVKHMEEMGYTNIKPEMFYNSAMAASQYVKKHYEGNKAYYIGKQGMKDALNQEGFIIDDENPDFVFIGLDKDATYASYSKALSLILNGAKIIGTNNDRILAKPGGFEVGNGSVVDMFEYAANQKSPRIGKPNRAILDLCLEYFGLKEDEIILIGDNLETDIKLGYEQNIETVLVQTGVHTKEDIEQLKIYPTHVVNTLMDLVGYNFD